MIGVESEIPPRLLVPMCPRCGTTRVFRENGDPRIRCRRCKLDLYTDRPRSYAEMEGLVEDGSTVVSEPPVRQGLVCFARKSLSRLRVKLGIR